MRARFAVPVLLSLLAPRVVELNAQSTLPTCGHATAQFMMTVGDYVCQLGGLVFFSTADDTPGISALSPAGGGQAGFLRPAYDIGWVQIGNQIVITYTPAAAGWNPSYYNPSAPVLGAPLGLPPVNSATYAAVSALDDHYIEALSSGIQGLKVSSALPQGFVRSISANYGNVQTNTSLTGSSIHGGAGWALGGLVGNSFVNSSFSNQGAGTSGSFSANASATGWQFNGLFGGGTFADFELDYIATMSAGTVFGPMPGNPQGFASVTGNWSMTFTVTPEPSTLLLMGTGLLVIALVASRYRRIAKRS